MTTPHYHLFESEQREHVLVVNGSRIYDIDAETRTELLNGATAIPALQAAPIAIDAVPHDPPIRALSLAVAQKCNLGCSYCYAEGGDFGKAPQNMSWEVAEASVSRLLEEASRGDRVNLAFMGGEPLVNREVVRRATRYAAEQAGERGVRIGFSITTNGTLLNETDARFFEDYGFSVTVSLDGVGPAHDDQRPSKSGRGTYDQILKNIGPALTRQNKMQVVARVTVTPRNLNLLQTLDRFVALGFHSVGFAPMLSSPTGRDQLGPSELETMLERMIACGHRFEEEVVAGRRYPFSNMTSAMTALHQGTHRPYPCGAGAGYLGVSAEGDLSACHRFVEDEHGAMGSVTNGVDRALQRDWLATRHVHLQSPCNTCWARYLCGGGCHHEVVSRGRPACDYIRGWLHYCLGAYVRLHDARPDYFGERP